ncbi:choice-of-anchor M domain-containing protein [Nocardioides sp. SYSU D00065]|uniref:choice-of-anchor M domain-containing protein n=1 Tax=Nocardioides sp. SYSU D00065 TaxID=2817378 RepID=UPI001B32800B|nr:choice-of-anchor M domain-containing protein [Nocardioides sp. SYSU D00065]
MTTSTRPRRLAAALGVLVLALTAVPAATYAAEGDRDGDGALDQKLDDLAIVHGPRVLEAGHVDMGPKFDGDDWRFLIHDDVSKADADATSVWRYPDETVFRVLDQARLTQPDDPAYAFTGAAPGDPIWVVPQTQNPEVVWLGWNTQDPRVMETIDRGVTLSLSGVDGPGTVTVYLQSGSFGEPEVLWDSRKSGEQPLWVDVNTHTHANWVFTEPGVYLLRLEAEADLIDGTTVSDTQYLRFAVGTETSTDEALAASWSGPAEPEESEPSDGGAAEPAAAGSDDGVLVPVLVGAIIVVALALIAGFAVALTRSNRARRQVLGARAGGPDGGPDGGPEVAS